MEIHKKTIKIVPRQSKPLLFTNPVVTPKTKTIFKCQYCGHESQSKDDLMRHMTAKHKDKMAILKTTSNSIFTCEHCDFETASKDQLGWHKRMGNKKGFKCSYCDYSAPFSGMIAVP